MTTYRRQFEIHTRAGQMFRVDVNDQATASGSSHHDTARPSSGAQVEAKAPKDWRRKLLFLHKDSIAAVVEIREEILEIKTTYACLRCGQHTKSDRTYCAACTLEDR